MEGPPNERLEDATWQGRHDKRVRIPSGKRVATGPVSSLAARTATGVLMRRYERKRGPMGLGGAQSVKVSSPEILSLREGAEVLSNTAGNTARRDMASGVWAPGVVGRFELPYCHADNQGDPRFSSAREYACTSRRGEEGRRGCGSRITE